jgi:short-subunit dehydrogenase
MSDRSTTALITGASSGIGLELARLLAADGLHVTLVARDRSRLEQLAAELRGCHAAEPAVLVADLAESGAPRAICGQIEAAGRDVAVLVNNAGIGSCGRFAVADLGHELAIVQVNVAALAHLTGLVLPGMVRRRAGRILNVASTAAFQPGPLMASYYASKAYVLSFSEALAEELRGTGVTVTCLCPGPTRTDFQRRAGMSGIPIASGLPPMMGAAAVARAGYGAMRRGARLAVPGLLNRVAVFSVRLAPRRLVTAVVGVMNTKRVRGGER